MIKFKKETEFKDTEIGKVPRDWDEIRISKILEDMPKGKVPNKKYRNKGDIPYLSAKYLRGESDAEDYYSANAGYLVNDGEIIILWDGSNSGEILKAKLGLLASTMVHLVLTENVNKVFIYHFLKTFEEELKDAKSGTDDRHVDKEYFLSIPIPLPPPTEQSRIATVLSWFDDLIENKKKQNEILEKTAMAIFKSWFVDFEPFKDEKFVYSEELDREIPEGWEVKPIGKVAEFYKGLSYRSDELVDSSSDGEIFITLKIFKRGGGFRPEYKFYNGSRYSEEQIVHDGELVIALTDMTPDAKVVGAPALVILPYDKDKGILSLDAAKLELPEHTKEYVYLYLKDSQEENSTYANGVNVLHLNLELFKTGKYILLPPRPILQRFHSLVEPLFKKIILNQKEIMVLLKIRDALLPLLVFGKLRVVEL